MAEKVVLPVNKKKQMVVAEDHKILLKQVLPHAWSAHKTDVGLVKSASPLQFQVRPGAKLPYQRQYPLKPEAADGKGHTIKGLLDAGVLIKTRSTCNTPIYPIKKAHPS